MECLSLWEFCEGNLEWGSITADHEDYVGEGYGDRHPTIGALLGNLEGRLLYWGP